MELIIKLCVVSFCVFLLFDVCNTYSQCKVPNGDAGTCIAIAKCKTINDLYKKVPKTDDERLFLQQSLCGVGEKIKVCCPPHSKLQINPVIFPNSLSPTSSKPKEIIKPATALIAVTPTDDLSRTGGESPKVPDVGVCGVETSTANKIIGGGPTAIDQYPWLALLEYSGEVLACGGSLITSTFVLTAAHCLDTIHGKPKVVRLAEYNTTSYPTDVVEVDGGGFESITVTKIPVNSVFRHPDFDRSQKIHDIGLVKMEYVVKYTDFIKPICLPQMDYTVEFNETTEIRVAGWGTANGKKNEVKMDVDVPYMAFDECKIQHEAINEYNVCAGGVEGKDSCEGDSGGPLMYQKDLYYYVVGVVSYGPHKCGTAGVPGVYAHVFKYMSWINKVLSSN